MKNNIENGIYIPDEHRNLIPVDEWVKREDPTAAQAVVLVTDGFLWRRTRSIRMA